MSETCELGRSHYRWMVLFGVWLLYFCFGLTIAALAPLVAPVSQELALSKAAMGAILGAWPLVYIGAAIPCGALLDRIGERRGLLIAALIIALSGFLRVEAWDAVTLFLAVAIFGLGGPLISVGAPKIIAQWFEGPERGMAMGIYITGPSMGGLVALSLTNSLVMPWFDQEWRWVLALYATISLLGAVAWWLISRHSLARAADQSARAEPREKLTTAFAGLMAHPAVRILVVMAIGIFFYSHGLNNWLPEILRSRGLTPAAAGYWASLPVLVSVVASIVIPRFAVPSRRIPILAGLFVIGAAATLMLQFQPGLGLTVGLLLQGTVRGTMMTVAILTLMETPGMSQGRRGLAGGLFFTTAEIGGVLGPVTVGILTDLTGDFFLSLLSMTGLCLILLLLIWPLKRSLS